MEWIARQELFVGARTLHLCKDRVGEMLLFISHVLHTRGDSYVLIYALGMDFCAVLALISSI